MEKLPPLPTGVRGYEPDDKAGNDENRSNALILSFQDDRIAVEPNYSVKETLLFEDVLCIGDCPLTGRFA
jgi:hypothetical protein